MRGLALATVLVLGAAGGAVLLAPVPSRAQETAPDEPARAAPAGPHPLAGLWELRMERTVWWPNRVRGTLAAWDGPHGLRASVNFIPMWGFLPARVDVKSSQDDVLRFAVSLRGKELTQVQGRLQDGVFTGTAEWSSGASHEISHISFERLPAVRRFEADTEDGPFPRLEDPAAAGVDPAALDRLIWNAAQCDTDALVVVKDGRLLCDRTFLRPRGLCATQSVTKVVSSLAIPLLMEDGKIPRDLDTPLTTWFPEWKSDPRKSRITLRHVLTHTSGLAADGTQSMQASQNCLAYAAATRAVHDPGEEWEYSNQAMELLSGIVSQAAGMPADTYLATRVFAPLGIRRWNWSRDRAGTAPTYAGLDLSAADLARIGDLVALRGKLGEEQIVPEWWFHAIQEPCAVNDEVGLVWWLRRDPARETVVQSEERLERLRKEGFDDADALRPLVGRSFEGRDAWWLAVSELVGPEKAQALYRRLGRNRVGGEVSGPIQCVYHTGSMGQYLLVFPEARLVVVRQRRGFAMKELSPSEESEAGFDGLLELAADLLPD